MLLLWQGADAQLLLLNADERSFLAAYFRDFVLLLGRCDCERGDAVAANPVLDPLLAQLLCLTRGRWLRSCCTPCRTRVDPAEFERRRDFACLSHCCSLSVEEAHTEPQGLIAPSAPTLIYGGRGRDGCSYIQLHVGTATFRARHTLRRA